MFGLFCWTIEVYSAGKSIAARKVSQRPTHESLLHVTFGQLQTLSFIVGGVYALLGNPRGLYGVAFGIMIVFLRIDSNAWVLLVEILR